MQGMLDIVVRKVDGELVRRIRADAALKGESFKLWVETACTQRLGVKVGFRVKGENYGDEQRRAEGVGKKDHGKTRSSDSRGETDLRDVDEESGDLHAAERIGGKGVRNMRSRVRGHSGKQDKSSDDRARTILGSSSQSQPESATVGGGAPENRGGEGKSEERVSVVDRPYVGPAHRKGCGCGECKAKR
jgi:hypothetical protein